MTAITSTRLSRFLAGLAALALVVEVNVAGPTLHEKCTPLPTTLLGPFVRLGDGKILVVDDNATRVSADEGKTWSQPRPIFGPGQDVQVSSERALLRTRGGVVILAFMNLKEQNFKWDPVKKDAVAARLPTFTIRSLDDGKTWQDLQKLHDEYTGAIRDMIQTREGRVVFTTMAMAMVIAEVRCGRGLKVAPARKQLIILFEMRMISPESSGSRQVYPKPDARPMKIGRKIHRRLLRGLETEVNHDCRPG